jgi:DNA polymerase-3 subunit delta
MRIAAEGLSAALAERLLPVYLLSGEEPLLLAEAGDAIRARARALGYGERQVFFIEASSAVWEDVRQAAQALSLFSTRRVVEVRMRSGKPGVLGAAVLTQLLQSAGDDLLVMIITEKLERETQGSPWVQLAQQRGAWVALRPVERAQLPQWLRARFAAAGLSAAEDALALLAERSEGNLLAARQEIDKLAMLLPAGAKVSLADVATGSADSARFDVFQLAEAVRRADVARALRILGGLKAEGAAALLALWALTRELRSQQAAAPSAARARPGALPFARLVLRAGRVDRMAKGLISGDPWDELALLAVELSGVKSLPLVRTEQ